MRILYLDYWSLDDGLTQATVLPHVRLLLESGHERVVLVTVERQEPFAGNPPFGEIAFRHVALGASRSQSVLRARVADFVSFPRRLGQLAEDEQIDLVLARGSPAGALAHLMRRHRPLPYVVESFEPHADYMRESGVWRWFDPRYVFQKRWELAQSTEASVLLPVTEAYRERLIARGVHPDRLVTLPCTVDVGAFAFSPEQRLHMRNRLGIAGNVQLGVYVGKFGGIYYAQEAFRIFGAFLRARPDFRLLVLSHTPTSEVHDLARAEGFPLDRMTVLHARHSEVSAFLSASDLGFAPIRPAPSRRFCSPIKIGEYWAAGLPVVITEGVGDDSAIVATQRAGAVVELSNDGLYRATKQVDVLLSEPGHRARIADLARQFRGRERVAVAYRAAGLMASAPTTSAP